MLLKATLSKHLCTCVGVFVSAFTLTVVVCSISMKISILNKIRNADLYDDEASNKNLYDDYFEAKYKATFEFVDNIIFIKKRVERLNNEQRIFNQRRYGPVKSSTFILVIQVHDNTAFLKVLLGVLKNMIGISNSLLILCHDYYDDNINKIISAVRFAKYMQVFYPYSSQMYPKMFPGSDTKFCTGDFNCTELCTESSECLRTHYLVQQKHFWWWHVNYVFNHLHVTQDYNEPIMFLEENQYVLEDFLFMLKVLGSLMAGNCPECEVINFGAHAPEMSQFHILNGKVTIESWHPGLLHIGMAFNRTVWKTIQDRSYDFCNFDDYRWNASLHYSASRRPKGPLVMLSSDAPRVLQMQLCDGSIPDCTLLKSIEDMERFAKMVHRGLYPRNIIFNTSEGEPGEVTAAGEWKDVRDHALCMYFAMN